MVLFSAVLVVSNISDILNSCLFSVCSESAEAQSSAAEDRANKLKQLLVKSKKDLAEAKKVVSNKHLERTYEIQRKW